VTTDRQGAWLALVACLVLGACGSGERETAKGTAAGEILPGSASDAMLPLDTVRSQAPLAPRTDPAAKAAGKMGAAQSEAEAPGEGQTAAEAAPAAEAAEAPAPE
jgi:hypothetical protein